MDYHVSRSHHGFPGYVRVLIAQTRRYMLCSFTNDFKATYYGVMSLLIGNKLLEGYISYETLSGFYI